MFAVERYRVIKNCLYEQKHVEVTALSQMLGVSEVTIRRDLEKLENDGILTRTYGGAIMNEEIPEEPPEITPDRYSDQRKEIASIATLMIRESDTIMLAAGTTNLQIARQLSMRENITVLTNDMHIAFELSANTSITLVMLGGNIDPQTKSSYGMLADKSIRQFYVDKAFIEVDGISAEAGLTVSSMAKASFLNEVSHNANQKIIVALSHVFGRKSFSQLSKVKLADKIITDSKLDDRYKNYMFENDVPLFTSINSYEGQMR